LRTQIHRCIGEKPDGGAPYGAFHGVWGIVIIDMLGYRKYPRQ
jgi:hypothetical protein